MRSFRTLRTEQGAFRAWRTTLSAFSAGIRGSVGLTMALLLPVLVGIAGLGVDVGSVYLTQKRLQGAVDLAALSAVSDVSSAEAMARRVMAENGFTDIRLAVENGTYTPDRSLAPETRFKSGTAGNALRVSATVTAPLFFAQVFRPDGVGLAASATATTRSAASFSIASRLAALDGGIINQILQQTLGTSLSLSVMDSNTLASAKFSGGALAAALMDYNPQATYGALFDNPIDARLFIAAMAKSARNAGNLPASAILTRLSNGTVSGRFRVIPSALVAIPDAGHVAVGYPARALGMDVNVLDLLTATMMANSHQTAVTLALSVPPLAGVSLELMLGEQEQASLALAPIGTEVSTAQLKARIKVSLLGEGLLAPLGKVQLPIEIVAAGGTARLNAVSCTPAKRGTLGVTAGIAKVEIGDWGTTPLEKASLARLSKPATLVSILGITATTRSILSLQEPSPVSAAFSASDITTGTVKTVATRHFATSLAADLLANLDDIDVSILGLPILPKGTIKLGLLNQLLAVTAPIDVVLNSVLDLAGLRLGEASVRMGSVDCGSVGLAG